MVGAMAASAPNERGGPGTEDQLHATGTELHLDGQAADVSGDTAADREADSERSKRIEE